MVLFAPLSDSYLQNFIKPPNHNHQILIPLLLKTVMCIQKLDKTLAKLTVTYDVYRSIYVECPSSFTLKTNANNNKQEALRMIDLKPVNQLMMSSAITKTATLATTFNKILGGANPFVWFG